MGGRDLLSSCDLPLGLPSPTEAVVPHMPLSSVGSEDGSSSPLLPCRTRS